MKDIGVYVEHIVVCLRHLTTYTASGRDEFFQSTLIQDAVFRNLQVIGEAVKRIPDDVRSRYPDVPWRHLSGLRDVVVHDYDELILEEIWTILTDDLLPLALQFTEILKQLDADKD